LRTRAPETAFRRLLAHPRQPRMRRRQKPGTGVRPPRPSPDYFPLALLHSNRPNEPRLHVLRPRCFVTRQGRRFSFLPALTVRLTLLVHGIVACTVVSEAPTLVQYNV